MEWEPLSADEMAVMTTWADTATGEHYVFRSLNRAIATVRQRDTFLIRLLKGTGLGVLHTVEPGDLEEIKVRVDGKMADDLIKLVHEIVPHLNVWEAQNQWDKVKVTIEKPDDDQEEETA